MTSNDPNKQSDTSPVNTNFEEEYMKHQISKINKMTITDLLKSKRTPVEEVNKFQSITLLEQARLLNKQMNVQNRYLGERTPGQLWTNLKQQAIDMKSADLYQQRISKTMNYAKRGRLGIDLYLIGFATLGIIGIPLYFYYVGKRQRQRKVKSRILTPAQIKNLDEDSAVNIDDVSQQVIMYYNPQREARKRQERRQRQQYQRVLRQIDQM